MAELPARKERAVGALTGLAVGDALGWPQEQNAKRSGPQREPQLTFESWYRASGSRFAKFQEPIERGGYSDDTQLALCVARSLLSGGDWFAHFVGAELPFWSEYQRGGGRSVLRASRAWAKGKAPWEADKRTRDAYFATGANGVAMRILPHAIAGLGKSDFGSVRQAVFIDGVTTHGHAAALMGAALHLHVLWTALSQERTLAYGDLITAALDQRSAWDTFVEQSTPHGWLDARAAVGSPSLREEWASAQAEAQRLLTVALDGLKQGALADDEETLRDLGMFDRKVNGSGLACAVASAFIASRSAASPAEGLLTTAFLPGSDTDTLASMTASVLGAVAGSEWMGTLSSDVQDATYVRELVDRLLALDPYLCDPEYRPSSGAAAIKRFGNELAEAAVGASIQIPDGRLATIEGMEQLYSRSERQQVVRRSLRTTDGQTLFIVKSTKADQNKTANASPVGVTRIGVRFPVARLRESRKFYEEAIGLTPTRVGAEFVTYGETLGLESGPVDPYPDSASVFRIVLQVTDVKLIYERVKRAKCEVLEPYRIERGRPRFTCRDPDGRSVEVLALAQDRDGEQAKPPNV